MKNLEELQAERPRLYQVACELSTYEDPNRVLHSLFALLSKKKEGTTA